MHSIKKLSTQEFFHWKEKSRAFCHSSSEKRIELLKILEEQIKKHQSEIISALYKDLGKSEVESYLTELGPVFHEIHYFEKNLNDLSKRTKVKSPSTLFGSKNYIHYQGKGFILILSPWNYPFNLSMMPLIAAIASGNHVCLKASEFTPNTTKVTYDLIQQSDLKEHILCIEGDHEIASDLCEQPFDHIFFTGSTNIGKKVMASAAKNLSPVTLELGGKSPCLVLKDANLEMAAERIVWGKFLNAGQTCVAPDYLLVDHTIKDELSALLTKKINDFYGKTLQDKKESHSYGRIIHGKHFDKLVSIKDKSLEQGAKLITGGESDKEKLYIDPTIIEGENNALMEDEIFGPILPLLTFENDQDLEKKLRKHPNPLALYVFTENENKFQDIAKIINSGGIAKNTVATHLANPYLPFGGVGASGMGKYHGKWGFEELSHLRSFHEMNKRAAFNFFIPPYNERFLKYFNKFKDYLLKL